MWLVWTVGEETQADPAPPRDPGATSGMPGLVPLQPSRRQSYRRQTQDKTHMAKHRHVPGLKFKERRRTGRLARWRDVPNL